ncbi:N-acetylglucosamine kinase [Granulosicoccus antarcticus]|uniref:ATPase BadF/BadG/BcrA/BcrD type domain-containing protein n=1 Tax=Granulosicoccus antarcticus IMCC3135 TaxID=1192854 RepID=A0A2Z2NQF2_9GAMM|nr:BadF/BadG/BcrA/BcrD ATPase family protein [Granulosicoccus antarcticus]ASJ73716.1 hypothetical protein IMCC3135_18185 [Granulosicoccus antarcticus IMCC3135]
MSIVAGIDSGGTKTIFAACDKNAKVTSFHLVDSIAPTPNAPWVGKFEDLLSLDSSVVNDAERLVLGLPFHGEDQAYSEHQSETVRRCLGDRAVVQNDVHIAFDGALAGSAGVLVLAGTGSMAWGSLNGPNDRHFRVGGWGETIGDEGSAFWIGRSALQTLSRHLDGRETAAEFSQHILSDLGIEPTQLHSWIHSSKEPRKHVATLAIIVSKLSQSGNATAHTILTQAADHLAEHVLTLWRQLKTDKPLAWSYAGGVFNSPYIVERLQERLSSAPLLPRLPPIGGALLQASHKAGWSIDDAWISQLALSLEARLKTTSN